MISLALVYGTRGWLFGDRKRREGRSVLASGLSPRPDEFDVVPIDERAIFIMLSNSLKVRARSKHFYAAE